MRLCIASLLLWVIACAASISVAADAPMPPVSPEVIDALKSLKTADVTARQKVYDLLAQKGDARLIPALTAFRDGSLQLRDGRLTIYGPRVEVPDRGKVLPLIDAVTGEPVLGPDNKPIYFPKVDLSQAMKAPPRLEKAQVSDVIDSLSLLDPDPTVRIASIRETGSKAVRALPDSADSDEYLATLKTFGDTLKSHQPVSTAASAAQQLASAITAAIAERPAKISSPAPSQEITTKIAVALNQLIAVDPSMTDALAKFLSATSTYQGRLDLREKALDELPKSDAAIKRQLANAPSEFQPALQGASASFDLVLGDPPKQIAAATALGRIGTVDATGLLHRAADCAARAGDKPLQEACESAIRSANRYQAEVSFISYTFAGLSAGSILVLLALGLSIIFGLMGVINMAQGEFMMLGAFTTFVVSEFFKNHLPPGLYDYYPIVAVPAAFLVSAVAGWLCEWLIIRHLYGRPLETLLATWGVGLVLVQAVRNQFGDNLSVKPPSWMEGGWEVIPDLVLARNRIYIVIYCAICIAIVYIIVNRTKLGLLLRATTQNRQMAAALGVPTRRVDALTFAFGTGLAGLAGVAVPLYNKINPSIGSEYIVDSFMVVVVGGVGTLAGAIWAGFGLGFLSKYLEPLLASIPAFSSSSSVIGKVLVLLAVVIFLQWRPSGLFPPKGRLADA